MAVLKEPSTGIICLNNPVKYTDPTGHYEGLGSMGGLGFDTSDYNSGGDGWGGNNPGYLNDIAADVAEYEASQKREAAKKAEKERQQAIQNSVRIQRKEERKEYNGELAAQAHTWPNINRMEPNLLDRMRKNRNRNRKALNALATDVAPAVVNQALSNVKNVPTLATKAVGAVFSAICTVMGAKEAHAPMTTNDLSE